LSIFIIVLLDCWIFIIARKILIKYYTILVSLALAAVRNLANMKRTIISTIHQPSAAVVDKLMVLLSGRVIYFGPTATANEYYKSLPMTYVQEENSNPAELFVSARRCRAVTHQHNLSPSFATFTLFPPWSNQIAISGGFIEAFDGHNTSTDELSSLYAGSTPNKDLVANFELAVSIGSVTQRTSLGLLSWCGQRRFVVHPNTARCFGFKFLHISTISTLRSAVWRR
jgi:hypothetical protein